MRPKNLLAVTLCFSLLAVLTGTVRAQHDPGPRGGPAGAGNPVAGISSDELRFFNSGADQFAEVEAVPDGLGPTFNGDCVWHLPFAARPWEEPVPASTRRWPWRRRIGAYNFVPTFIATNGPVREARFKYQLNRDGSPDRRRPDGGVHDLFTIAGRDDATGCVLAQPNFAQAIATHNVIFRIPTPVFGAGLIESIDEATILANMNANAATKLLGHRGQAQPQRQRRHDHPLRLEGAEQVAADVRRRGLQRGDGRDQRAVPQRARRGTVELPVQLAPENPTNFLPDPTPDDSKVSERHRAVLPLHALPGSASSGAVNTASTTNGLAKFNAVGCALCHTPSLTTGNSNFAPAALSGVQANLFSDLLLHQMGEGLQDDISQGLAHGDEFRTAPLWGLGQRLYFLHDGRTSDLLQAIRAHRGEGSEANRVINNFNGLSPSDQQDILNFLRSL